MPKCDICDKEFKSPRGLATHKGMKHKNVSVRPPATDEGLIADLVDMNKDLAGDDEFGFMMRMNQTRAVQAMREIRATLGQYGVSNESIQQVVAAEGAFGLEAIRTQASETARAQNAEFGRSVNSRILAAQRLAEDVVDIEGDVYSAIVSPIELGMNSRVWISGADNALVKDVNDRLKAWNAMDTISNAWLDMETYSAFYITNIWKDEVPTPIHWSPKRVWVGPDMGFGPYQFYPLLSRRGAGDALQTQIEFGEAPSGKEWNEWMQDMFGKPLDQKRLTWIHLLKWRHKMYPYPWLAKASTPVYTRQVIEEMRLALVQGMINQLWVMTIDNPAPKEVSRLKSVIATNRAERVGFLLWRSGLDVNVYHPESIEQLLLPDAWWSATLDIFRRIGRTVRIVSGESATRGGMGSIDAEIDVRIAQNKAMAHRDLVARKVVLDLVRQWGEETKNGKAVQAVAEGKIDVHTSPIQLFLGEDLKNIWGPMWDRGMASARTIHASIGLDTDTETELLKAEQEQGYDEIYVARQQFAQRVATPGGDVTRSSEPGRPEGEFAKAAVDDVERQLLTAYGEMEAEEDDGDKRQKALAFIVLLSTLMRAHIRNAYLVGYGEAGGDREALEANVARAIDWEMGYIEGYRDDLLKQIDGGKPLSSLRFRVTQHVQASYKRGYMDGVFQAKEEDGWTHWRRVLRPWASKSGPCPICIEDSKNWHPISEPFWDHPYGVCSMQVVRFMRSSAGWVAEDRSNIEVPLVDWEE